MSRCERDQRGVECLGAGDLLLNGSQNPGELRLENLQHGMFHVANAFDGLQDVVDVTRQQVQRIAGDAGRLDVEAVVPAQQRIGVQVVGVR